MRKSKVLWVAVTSDGESPFRGYSTRAKLIAELDCWCRDWRNTYTIAKYVLVSKMRTSKKKVSKWPNGVY